MISIKENLQLSFGALTWSRYRLCLLLSVLLMAWEVQSLSQVYIPSTIAPLEEVSQFWLDRVEQAQDDARAYVQLGRIHCFAYAFGRTHFVVDDPTSHYGNPGIIRERALVPLHTSTLLLPASAEQLNHLAEAMRWLREGLKREPEHREGLLLLGYAYVEAAKRCRADGWIHDGVEFDRDAANNLGGSQYWEDEALGQFREALALKWAAKPPRPEPDTPKILVHLPDGTTTQVDIPTPQVDLDLDYGDPDDFDSLYIHQILSRRSNRSSEEETELASVLREAKRMAGSLNLQWSTPDILPVERTAELAARADALYPVVADGENGALYYLAAMEAVPVYEPPEGISIPFHGVNPGTAIALELPDTTRALIQKIIAANDPTFRLLRTARSFPACRYPIDLWQGPNIELKHLPPCRQVAYLGALRVFYLAEHGNSGEVTDAILDLVGLAGSLTSEPTTISQLVRTEVARQTLAALELALNRAPMGAPEILRIQQALEELNSLEGYRTALEGELWSAEFPPVQESPIEEILWNKEIDWYAPNQEVEITEEELKAVVEERERKFEEERAARRAYFQALLDHAAQSLPALYQFADSRGGLQLSADSGTVPGLAASGRVTAATIAHIARVRTALAALAVLRYLLINGELPPDLDTLIPDYIAEEVLESPFTGERLNYSVNDDRFAIRGGMDAHLKEIGQVRRGQNASAETSFTVLRER